jgi:hypothetical protein
MSNGEILLYIVVGISLGAIVAPFLFGALRESRRFKTKRRPPSAFRQFPTFPVQGEEWEEPKLPQYPHPKMKIK